MDNIAVKSKENFEKKGLSCHQCKSKRSKNQLVWCNYINYSYKCTKKYCENCLKKFYNISMLDFNKEKISNWKCPACDSNCSCAACRRKDATKTDFEMANDYSLEKETDSDSEDSTEFGDAFSLLYETAQNPGNKLQMMQILSDEDLSRAEKIEAISKVLEKGIYLKN